MKSKFSIFLTAGLMLTILSPEVFSKSESSRPKNEPTPFKNKAQFQQALKYCHQKFSGNMRPEFGAHYGKSQWWCVGKGF